MVTACPAILAPCPIQRHPASSYLYLYRKGGRHPTTHTYPRRLCVRRNGNKNISLQILFSFIRHFYLFSCWSYVCTSVLVYVPPRIQALLYLFSFLYGFQRRRWKPLLYARRLAGRLCVCVCVCRFCIFVSLRLPGTYPGSWRWCCRQWSYRMPSCFLNPVGSPAVFTLRFVFKSRSAVAQTTFCWLPLLKQ